MELAKEIKKSFRKIEGFIPPEKLEKFKNTSPKYLEKYNYGLGTMIRLKLLRPKSVLYRAFIENGFTDKDEMTIEIITSFHKNISSVY